MLKFLKLLNARCEDHARLISMSMDSSLPFSQRLAVKSHLLYCRACRQFRKQALLMRETIRTGKATASEFPHASTPALSSGARDKIAAALKQRSNED